MNNQKSLSQFFTPAWAAQLLFNKHFPYLTQKDLVWEPTCGTGACLAAIPAHIPAVGTEIDPTLIPLAIANTSRPIYQGDFRSVTFPELSRVTAIFGNPPFSCDLFEQFLHRCTTILKKDNKAAFILPAYFFQTSATLLRFARKWDIHQEMIPRDLFKGCGVLSKPLIFASFIRNDFPKLFGFTLYQELRDINGLNAEARESVSKKVSRSVWKDLVIENVKAAGGTVSLQELYERVQGKRPTENPFWKDQIRKVIQQSPFVRVGEAKYQLIN